jgi:hypothetical protein
MFRDFNFEVGEQYAGVTGIHFNYLIESTMLTKKRIPLLIATITCIEILIYLWAVWTTTFDKSNFFAIEQDFIFDKCARIAGRISSVLFLITLLMVGYYGLKKIYSEEKKKELFLISITLFTINHQIHLLFVFLRFRSHTATLSIAENLHGFITFIFIIIVPFILWTHKHLTRFLYIGIILHLLNISYFINKTFLGKVKPPVHPAYHNQFGIVVITAACIYIAYRVYQENMRNWQLTK